MRLKIILAIIALICLVVPLLLIIAILPSLFLSAPDSADKLIQPSNAVFAGNTPAKTEDAQKSIAEPSKQDIKQTDFAVDKPKQKDKKSRKTTNEPSIENSAKQEFTAAELQKIDKELQNRIEESPEEIG